MGEPRDGAAATVKHNANAAHENLNWLDFVASACCNVMKSMLGAVAG